MPVNSLEVFQSLFSLSLLVTNPSLIYLRTTSWNSIWYHRLTILSYLISMDFPGFSPTPLSFPISFAISLNGDVLYNKVISLSDWYPREISFTSMSPRSAFSNWTYLLSSWPVYLKAFWNSYLNVSKSVISNWILQPSLVF